MTDNKNLNKTKLCDPVSPISMDDEKLLESFFADCRMDIPDDGFSDRVMAALPSVEAETRTSIAQPQVVFGEVRTHRRLEHLWTAACVAIGIIAAVVCQGWEQIQGLFYSMKLDFLMSGSRAVSHAAETLGHANNLWMMLAGVLVLFMVWGYNAVQDSKHAY